MKELKKRVKVTVEKIGTSQIQVVSCSSVFDPNKNTLSVISELLAGEDKPITAWSYLNISVYDENGELIDVERVDLPPFRRMQTSKQIFQDLFDIPCRIRVCPSGITEDEFGSSQVTSLPESKSTNGFVADVEEGAKEPQLFHIVVDNKWGFIDKVGNLVVETHFDDVGRFLEGMCSVKLENNWGFINSKGETVINPCFEDVGDFREGMAAVKSDEKWGFIDTEGELVISPQFEVVKGAGFKEGLAAVRVDEKWGFIDTEGELVISPQFHGMDCEFNEGLASVISVEGPEGYSWIYINKFGQPVMERVFDMATSFHGGVAFVQLDKKWGMINRSGEFIVPLSLEWVPDSWHGFSDGLTKVRVSELYGFLDGTGKYVINPQFAQAEDFSGGLARVSFQSFFGKERPLFGYINRTGKIMIEPEFYRCATFSEGRASVMLGDKWGFIDMTGKLVIPPQFFIDNKIDVIQNVHLQPFFKNGLAWVWLGKKIGYIDIRGQYVWGPIDVELKPYDDRLFLKKELFSSN